MNSNRTQIDEQQIFNGLSLALVQAEKAKREQTYPIGAIITSFDGTVIAQAHNRVKSQHDPTAHAEIEVIRKAGLYLQKNKGQGILYTTIEPCLMCIGAILAADISVLVWGVSDSYGGAVDFVANSYQKENLVMPHVIAEPFPELGKMICELMRTWELSRGYPSELWGKCGG